MRSRTSCGNTYALALPASFLAVAIGLLGVVAAVAADGPKQFRAACVKVDITPETPQWLQGYNPRQSTGVHDRIYHRIAALDDGTTTFYLVSTDIAVIEPSSYHKLCERLERETNIRSPNIWWTTTHTHSAPTFDSHELARLFTDTIGDRFSITLDAAYRQSVQDKLVCGIQEAQSRLEPARLAITSSTAAANVNRRERRANGKTVLGVNPEGPVDRQLGVLRLERPDGTLIGLIANYTVHGTAMGGGNTLITGDVPGFAEQYVERSTGVPMLFINGSVGNTAPLYSVGDNIDDPRLKEYDSLLGERIVAANAAMKNATADVTLRFGKTVVETPRKAGLGWPSTFADYSATSADGTHQVRVPVYTLIINGDTVIWAAPLELFSEIALNVRAASPFARTFYFGLTNGDLLYLPTKAAFAEGGYEPSVSPFTDAAEAHFTTAVTQYLRQLRN